MKYKAVLYDMDGTVLDTLADLTDAVNVSLRHFGLPEQPAMHVRDVLGNGARRLIKGCLPEGTDERTADAVLEFYKPYYDAHCREKTAPLRKRRGIGSRYRGGYPAPPGLAQRRQFVSHPVMHGLMALLAQRDQIPETPGILRVVLSGPDVMHIAGLDLSAVPQVFTASISIPPQGRRP